MILSTEQNTIYPKDKVIILEENGSQILYLLLPSACCLTS